MSNNLYLWRDDDTIFHFAYAPNLETAKQIIISQLPNHPSYIEYLESVFKTEPQIFTTPKGFSIWSDICDFYEST